MKSKLNSKIEVNRVCVCVCICVREINTGINEWACVCMYVWIKMCI